MDSRTRTPKSSVHISKSASRHGLEPYGTKTRNIMQPKRPSTDEWIKKMWYMYSTEYYSTIKKNKIMPFAVTWMDLEIVILSELGQTEKDKYHIILLIC